MPRDDRRLISTGLLAACGASALWLVVQALAPGWLPNIAWVPGGFALVLGACAAWRIARPGAVTVAGRRFWAQIAVGTALVTPGACLINAVNSGAVRATTANLVVAASFVAVALLLTIWALLRLPVADHARGQAVRLGLDAATIMVVAATVLWEFQVRPMIGSDPQLRTVIGPLLVCVICLGAVLAVVKLMLSGTDAVSIRSLQALGLLVLIGALGSAVTRILENEARWLGVGPLISTVEGVLVVWAALQPPAAVAVPADRRSTFSVMPYVAVAAIDVLLLSHTVSGRQNTALVIGSVLVTTVVVGRQIFAFRANADLIDSLREHRRMLQHQATHDPLTGLANRALFYEQVSVACARHDTAVLLLDLDGFKPVNDTLGHAAGDELLIEVARRLRDAAPRPWLVARLGGDEFAVLLPSADQETAREAADRIIAAMQPPVDTHGVTLQVRMSIGIAAYTDGDDAESLIRHADLAMYEAKAAGKNRHATYTAEPRRRADAAPAKVDADGRLRSPVSEGSG
ncbi:diguanylate cyclase [Actinoplanes sp. NEAU-A12]|uniref:Diguanylate cyclase n=1 Tax=Actinoplanes sandaracinus TaxID=3045177 RepID=A0ABT6WYG3_9ACTN|nr:diguanylate cyclase [Actinoplanes sandaracinus]MDI6104783.1 diguanylate cyclase [Actinoplanes sandaracinus]